MGTATDIAFAALTTEWQTPKAIYESVLKDHPDQSRNGIMRGLQVLVLYDLAEKKEAVGEYMWMGRVPFTRPSVKYRRKTA